MIRSILETGRRRASHSAPVSVGQEDVADGLPPAQLEAIWAAIECLYASGVHPAITLVLRHRGKRVLHRSIGYLDAARTRPAHPDSPICLFSASKAITALLVHKLVEDGRVDLDERVAAYIPEFGCHGKEHATVRQLLAHRAGIPAIPMRNPDPELLRDWPAIIRMLCAARPLGQGFEKQAYHAISGGFILGELVQRVSGLQLGDALKQWVADPLGCRYLRYGFPTEMLHELAENALTGPRVRWPFSAIALSILGLPFQRTVEISNQSLFHDSVVPSVNICASADDVGRFYEMMLRGGLFRRRRILKAKTIAEAVKPAGPRQLDGTLMLPMRFSAGFMLGEKDIGIFGHDSARAFGHIGFMNIISWADPQRDVSLALLNTGKSISPRALLALVGFMNAVNRIAAVG